MTLPTALPAPQTVRLQLPPFTYQVHITEHTARLPVNTERGLASRSLGSSTCWLDLPLPRLRTTTRMVVFPG